MRAISRLIPILIIGGLITIGVIFLAKHPRNHGEILIEYHDTLVEELIITREYGLAIDSFHIISGKIRRDQTLGTLLYSYGVSHDTIHKLAMASTGIFDLRKIRMGNPYKIFCSRDTVHRVLYFVYEHTPLDYVLFSLEDSIFVSRMEKEVIKLEHEVSGVIRSSLWNTMLDNDIDPMLAFELFEIYSLSI